jgi:hypothetical protein
VFETAAAMPVFLIALFGVIWAMKEASLSERVHLAVRYGGMVSSLQQPYSSYSLYAMYAAIDNVVPSGVTTCYPGDTTQLTAGYASFWHPVSSGPLLGSCPSSVVLITGPESYSQPIILRNDYATMTAAAPVSGFLSTAVLQGQASTSVAAAENFFRSPDVGALVSCTSLGSAVKASLEGAADTTTSTVPATPLPMTVAGSPVVTATNSTCASPNYAAPSPPY